MIVFIHRPLRDGGVSAFTLVGTPHVRGIAHPFGLLSIPLPKQILQCLKRDFIEISLKCIVSQKLHR